VYVSRVTLRKHLFFTYMVAYTRGPLPECIYARGKPTRLAPIPKPAPWRAVTPMLGEKISSTANTAAAAMVTVRISSRGRLFRGINTSASATATPSTTYLMMRVKRSFMSILIYICPSDFLLE